MKSKFATFLVFKNFFASYIVFKYSKTTHDNVITDNFTFFFSKLFNYKYKFD